VSRWDNESFECDMRQEVQRQRFEDGADDLRRERLAELDDEARRDARDDEREARRR
jgi:hypothetical protein